MEGTTARKPSLAERAAYLRRLKSRERTVNVNRTPNGPLAGTMANARDALSLAWEQTQDLRPDEPAKVASLVNRPSERARYNGKDEHGGINRPGRTFDYRATWYKSRLTGQGRVWSVRKDAWAREHAGYIGWGKLRELVAERNSLAVRAENVRGIGNGIAPHAYKMLRPYEAPTRYTSHRSVIDGWVYTYEQNRDSGEHRRIRRIGRA